MNCTGPNCYQGVLSTSNQAYNPAYGAGVGWDFATGLGSINAANLVNNWPASFGAPVLRITKTHSGNFTQGQQQAVYTITVSNGAGPTNGTVTVMETLPSGLTLASMAGSGWTCAANSCSRNDVLSGGASYPAITVIVNVAANASSPQVNQVSVSGGGSATASATDSTTIVGPPAAPTGLSAASFSGQVTLSWSPSSGATSYTVLRSTTSGSSYISIAKGLTSTSYADRAVTNGTTYYYVVQAVNAAGTSGNSSQASATPSVLSSWPNGYAYRRAITISHTQVVNTDQLSFPVLIAGTFGYLANTASGGCVTNPNGFDIVFTSDAGGNTPLPYERESYSGSTGAVDFWVQVPVLSHTSDTVIYVFYGNSSVTTDQSNHAGTWDSNYKAIWHLANGTTLSGADSSSNGVNGTNSSMTATAGLIDGAGAGDGGAGHQINTGNDPYPSSTFSSSGLTLSAWVKPASTSAIGQVVSLEGAYVLDVNSGRAGFEIDGSGNDLMSAASVPTGSWTYIVGTSDGSGNVKLYVNGIMSSSAPQSFFNLDSLMRPYSIGGHPVFSGYNFNGIIDEARISNISRSADWIATEYNNQNGSSSFFSVGPATTTGGVPFAPTGLTTTTGNAQVSLSWNASTGATSYTVLRSTTSGGSYSSVVTGLTATTYVDTGLTNGTAYYYVVQALNAAGPSPNSNQASATPSAPPAAPTLSASAGNAQVSLTWTASTGAGSYNVLRSTTSGGPYTTLTTGLTVTSYMDMTVTNGTTYYYVVQAVNSVGATASNQVPASPSVLFSWPNGYTYRRAVTIPHTQVVNSDQLNFPVLIAGTYAYLANTANGGCVSNANGYDIVFTSDAGGNTRLSYERESYSASTGAVDFWVQVPVLSHTSDTVIYMFYGNSSVTSDQSNHAGTWDSNYKAVWHLANGTTLSGADSSSNGVNGTNLGMTATAGLIAGAGAGDGGAGHQINTGNNPYPSSTFSSSGLTLSAWVKPASTSATSQVVSLEGAYVLDVTSGNAGFEINGSGSDLASAAPVPTGSWTYIVGTSDGSGNVKLYVNGTLSSSASQSFFNLDSLTRPYSIGGHPVFSGYNFNGIIDEARISNIARSADWIATEYNNQNGSFSFYSLGPAATTGGVPFAPTGLTTTTGNAQVSLSWNASTGATSYMVLRSTTSGGSYSSVVTGLTATTYTDTGVTNGTTYYYVIQAVNSAGSSPNSNEASATPLSLPAAPTLSASASNAQVSLTWSASTGASSYNVLRSTTSGGSYSSVVTGLTPTTYVDSGLTNGTAYYYVVQAVNAAGLSPNSNEAAATPNAPPAVPSGLSATAGNAQVSLTWTASTGASSYNVLRSITSGGSYSAVATSLTATNYTDAAVTNGTTYYYVVQAVNSVGTSGNSNEASATPSAPPAWTNGYGYRRAITIAHTQVPNTDQLNFPVLIAGTYTYLANAASGGCVSNANGFDIVFTSDAGGKTPLGYERESYSASTGTVHFWVQVPVVSHTSDTVIYMFYGNSSVTTDQSNHAGTWDSNFKAVWHLANGTTLSGADSSSNGVNGTNLGMTATAGLIAGAGAGDGGAGHQINTGNNPYPSSTFSSSGLTLSAWVKPMSTSATSQVVSLEGAYVLDVNSGRAGFEINGSGSDLTSAASVPTGSWTYIVGTSDSSGNLKLYVNGTLSSSASQSFFNLDTLMRPYSIGGHPAFSGYNFNGIIDEARISNISRSADWIATEYNNQNGFSSFFSIGAAATLGH